MSNMNLVLRQNKQLVPEDMYLNPATFIYLGNFRRTYSRISFQETDRLSNFDRSTTQSVAAILYYDGLCDLALMSKRQGKHVRDPTRKEHFLIEQVGSGQAVCD
jgi:hypothetical protein